jgi:8-oxo-dGTP pyrophosphatase MutT (NUDIX family)
MILRDAPDLQVLMLRRNARSDFVGGAMVFPGGAVDPHDLDPGLGAVQGRTDAEASAVLRLAAGGLGYWAAAVRECFEEAGLVLACGPLPGDAVARVCEHRLAVELGRRHLADVAAAEQVRFDVSGVHYFGHWITPHGGPRRYDTRFFVTAAPADQEPSHDEREAVAWEWVRPHEMLDRCRRAEAWLLPPTEACLDALAQVASAAALLADLASRPAGPPPLVADRGGVRVRLAHDGPRRDDAEDVDEIHDSWEFRCPT